MQLEFLTSVDSTMAYLQRLPDDVATDDLYVVVAETQTAGRGQRGTHWESESGKNLTLGLRVYPTFLKADEQFRLSEVTALAIAEALDLYTDGISIKWPNDIYWHDRKICGMLLEHDLRGSEIACTRIGPGININQRQFFSDAPNPVSLYQILGHDTDLTAFLHQFLQRFSSAYTALRSGARQSIDWQYHQRLYRREGLFSYADAQGTFRARLIGVLPDGTLQLEDEAGRLRKYAFKEVRFVL